MKAAVGQRGVDPELRGLLLSLEQTPDITQDRRRILIGIYNYDSKDFVAGVRGMTEALGRKPTETDILSIVNGRYASVTKYEPGKPARQELPTPEARALVDQHLRDRDRARLNARRLINQNLSLIGQSVGSGLEW